MRPELKEGEMYAGILLGEGGQPDQHIILLAEEMEGEANWKDAFNWALQIGGSLPTRREQSLLFANLKGQFEPTWYWSGEQHASDSSYAWYQGFSYGCQGSYHKLSKLRARAVRRVKVKGD